MSKAMNDETANTFGARLKAARTALGLETKDAAAQLRLNERIILMLESGTYDDELPITFLKGYIRSYGKLLQLPEDEIKLAIEPLQPKVYHADPALSPPAAGDITSKTYRMQFASALIGLTIIGLVGTWWHSHATTLAQPVQNAIPVSLPPVAETQPAPIQPPLAPTAVAPTAPTSSTAHPLANAMAQQISPAAAATTPAAAPEKPSTPAHKTAPAKVADDSADDDEDDDTSTDNNDNDQTD